MTSIRVLVVDDHPVVRHGLLALLRYEPEFEIAGDAADGEEAVAAVLAHKPDVVLLDLRLPRLSGVDVMLQARAKGSTSRFLVLTTYDSDDDITRALAAGAKGYLLKDATSHELIQAIREVMRGNAALEPSVAARVLARMHDSPADELSAREIDVLQRMVRGESNRAIAVALHVSENTVKTHVSHIFAKLAVQSRAEAVVVALRRGLVSHID
ncbi:MAG: response regulator [Roseiflexaceae bacterium]|jgi:DNA-binding NarL/FixJ family response regulator